MALEVDKLTAATENTARPLSTGWLQPGITSTDLVFFTEQLELLLGTGINLHSALTALTDQVSNPTFKVRLAQMADDVLEGKSFSQALTRHKDVFSPTYISLIGAAEAGGYLPDVLKQLLVMEEKRQELRSTLVAALSYPLFLLAFSLGVVVFILVFVFPKFGKMFVAIQDQLPASTRALMWASELFTHHGVEVAGACLASAFVLYRWARSDTGYGQLSRMKLGLPGLRSIFLAVYVVQWLRTMGTSLVNGVTLVESLRSCREVVNNQVVRSFIANVEEEVRDGSSFSNAFTRSEFMPPLVKQMVATGDETGKLGAVMIRIAEYYERELDKQLKKLSRFAEPLMLLIMGALVGLLVSSLILPIFKLTRAVG